jgi:hypothetical protein
MLVVLCGKGILEEEGVLPLTFSSVMLSAGCGGFY